MNTISLIKHQEKCIGVIQQSDKFLIGFHFRNHAEHVCKHMGSTPMKVKVKPGTSRVNVSRNIKLTLLDVNLPIFNVKDDVYLDNDAYVAFEKSTDDVATPLDVELVEMPYDRFMRLQYMNDFGIILPYEFVAEDVNHLLYKANVVDNFYTNTPFEELKN